MIHFCRDPDFVDRGSILSEIALQCSAPPYRVALVGLGGVGKSQLVIEHAYRVSEANTDMWVLWVYARTRARVEESFKTIADMAKLPSRNDQGANIFQIVCTWLASRRRGKWLMILDSADSDDVFFARGGSGQEEKPLAAYLPQNVNGSIVITTRDGSLARRLTGHDRHLISVGSMSETDAVTLLERRLGTLSDTDRSLAVDLVRALDLVPLAISQAGAYIRKRQPRTSLEKYLAEFRKGERKQAWLLEHEADNLRRDGGASNSVLTTWEISFEHIRQKRPSAAPLLSLMSFFDRQGIPEVVRPSKRDYLAKLAEIGTGFDIGPRYSNDEREDRQKDPDDVDHEFREESTISQKTDAAGDHRGDWGEKGKYYDGIEADRKDNCLLDLDSNVNDQFEDDVEVLRAYSLISVDGEGDLFEMHGLVQLSTRRWLERSGQYQARQLQFIERLTAAFPMARLDSSNWPTCQRLLPHVEMAVRYASADRAPTMFRSLLGKAARYAYYRGSYEVSEKLCHTALGVRGPSGQGQWFDAQFLLATLLLRKVLYRKAEIVAAEAVETTKSRLGPDHETTISAMTILARAYGKQGRYAETEKPQTHIEQNLISTKGPDHGDTLECKRSRAITLHLAGQLQGAERILRTLVQAFKSKYGVHRVETLDCMCDLALVLTDQGHLEEADEIFVQTVEIYKSKLGAEHPKTIDAMSRLGRSVYLQYRLDEAEKLFVQVIEASKQQDAPGSMSAYTSGYLCILATVFVEQGRLEEAEDILQGVLRELERTSGPDSLCTLDCYGDLGRVWLKQGRLQEAEVIMTRTMVKQMVKLGTDHKYTLGSMKTLSLTWWAQGRKADALVLMQRALEGRQRQLGIDHWTTKGIAEKVEEWSKDTDVVSLVRRPYVYVPRSFPAQQISSV
ncbi:hypothetical protein GE09DRAFT_1079792 [Coniochaeta sp. 2T2.1]|nr:hypothetical protein GE09DRAFT_1079792 [Coniochaeta sp. 2T2.1]